MHQCLFVVSVIVTCHLVGTDAVADVQPDPLFSNHMVLQRDIAVPIWGTSAAGEKVSVAFGEQEKVTTADKYGNWTVKLDPLKVGAWGELTISGKNSITLKDVLVGDVWLGSGQSNMARVTDKHTANDAVLADLVKSAPYPELRLFFAAPGT